MKITKKILLEIKDEVIGLKNKYGTPFSEVCIYTNMIEILDRSLASLEDKGEGYVLGTKADLINIDDIELKDTKGLLDE